MKLKIIKLVSLTFLMLACTNTTKKENDNEEERFETNSKAEVKKSNNSSKRENINANCFNAKDVEQLNIFLTAISNQGLSQSFSYIDNFSFKVRDEDLKEFGKLLEREDLDSFELRYENVQCDPFIGLFLYYRNEYNDGYEIHYAESSDMYDITKNNNLLILSFYATAG